MNLAPVLVSKLRSNFNESRLFLPIKIVKLCYCNNSNNWGNMNQSIKINYLIEIKDSWKKERKKETKTRCEDSLHVDAHWTKLGCTCLTNLNSNTRLATANSFAEVIEIYITYLVQKIKCNISTSHLENKCNISTSHLALTYISLNLYERKKTIPCPAQPKRSFPLTNKTKWIV